MYTWALLVAMSALWRNPDSAESEVNRKGKKALKMLESLIYLCLCPAVSLPTPYLEPASMFLVKGQNIMIYS